jgi:crossover junction endodeoxyribonuclease RuvC
VRVLGVDPGSHRTGWGVVVSEGSRLVHVASGAIEVNGGTLPQRLRGIGDGLDRVIGEHAPEAVSVESVFHARNAKSALMLGHARGVVLLCAARCELPVFEYTAGQIKQATTGRGRADKQQVQSMVQITLGYRQEMSLDTSDALAAAICHAHMETSPTAQLLRGLSRGRSKSSEVGR